MYDTLPNLIISQIKLFCSESKTEVHYMTKNMQRLFINLKNCIVHIVFFCPLVSPALIPNRAIYQEQPSLS